MFRNSPNQTSPLFCGQEQTQVLACDGLGGEAVDWTIWNREWTWTGRRVRSICSEPFIVWAETPVFQTSAVNSVAKHVNQFILLISSQFYDNSKLHEKEPEMTRGTVHSFFSYHLP